jgi:D-inositol-3-phosphate glycosyltransferase
LTRGPRQLAFVFPGVVDEKLIMGAQVAELEFLRALLKHGTIGSFAIAARGDRKALGRATDLIAEWSPQSRCKIVGFHQLPEWIGQATPDALHVSHILTPQFAYLRQRFSLRPFPMTSIVHAIAHLDAKITIDRHAQFPGSALDVAVCPSDHVRKAFLSIAREARGERFGLTDKSRPLPVTKIIPLGVDTDRFKPGKKIELRAANGIPAKDVVLLYVGRLNPWSKMDLLPLLVAFRRLIQRCPAPPVTLVLAGQEQADGYGSILAAAAHALGVGERVLIWTGVPPQEMQNVYAMADIFVSPTDNIQESFGLTPIEAMASGLAPVVAAWDGYKEHIEDSVTGYLIPTYRATPDRELTDAALFLGYESVLAHMAQTTAIDLNLMVERLVTLVRSRAARLDMGRRARQAALQRYSWPAIVSAYEDLWRRLAGRARRFAGNWRQSPFSPYQTNYSRHFAHYASRRIRNDTRVSTGNIEGAALSDQTLSSLAKFAKVDWGLACRLRARLVSSKTALSVASLRRNNDHTDALHRALVFLLKHGQIQIVGR